MLLSIIIPTCNRNDILSKHIHHLQTELTGLDYEVIIINDSKINNVTLSEKVPYYIKFFNNPKSGVASARNYGAQLAKGEWLLFLDDDMIIFKENIDSYLKYCDVKEKFCVNIEWVYPPEVIEDIKKKSFGRFLIKYGFTTMRGWNNNSDWDINSSILVDSIASANLFIKKEYFFQTGGYDEKFPFAGFEDYTFSKLLKSHQFKMYVDTTSLMFHNEEDRLTVNDWFIRKERGGETRKIAVNKGNKELRIKHNLIKKMLYSINPIFIFLLKNIVSITDNYKILDKFSFSCYKLLLGIYIYRGYNKK